MKKHKKLRDRGFISESAYERLNSDLESILDKKQAEKEEKLRQELNSALEERDLLKSILRGSFVWFQYNLA